MKNEADVRYIATDKAGVVTCNARAPLVWNSAMGATYMGCQLPRGHEGHSHEMTINWKREHVNAEA